MYEIHVTGYPEDYKEDICWPCIALSEKENDIFSEAMKQVKNIVLTAQHHSVNKVDIEIRYWKQGEEYPIEAHRFWLIYKGGK